MLSQAMRLLTGVAAVMVVAATGYAQTPPPLMLDQGPVWSDVERADFYSRDQGSRLMPRAWMDALKRADGQPFMGDRFTRYGYLPNPADSRGMPIGFTVSGPKGAQVLGMTCAACHTREITAQGKSYRVDGGPALSDFQQMLTDLDTAVGAMLANDDAFASFAAAVTPVPPSTAALRSDVEAWYARFHALISRALPTTTPWGTGRLDALGMIFDRLTGLDLGPPESKGMITGNIRRADAPVRYPFLWNAALQDHTQWPGIAGNGDDFLALARNLGEVYGVFGEFYPRPASFPSALNVDYLHDNSGNFDGLSQAESLVRRIGPPRWPWPADQALAAKGQAIFDRSTAEGGCGECHGVRPGIPRAGNLNTWWTPIVDVGTDAREYSILQWQASTGSLRGALVPFTGLPLGDVEGSPRVLKTAVLGAIIQHQVESMSPFSSTFQRLATGQTALPTSVTPTAPPLPPELKALEDAYGDHGEADNAPAPTGVQGVNGTQTTAVDNTAPPAIRYESRVLQGIWAAAPYLHNGSVPTLAELLKHPADRVTAFKVGPAFDVDTVGLAVDQAAGAFVMQTTPCADRASGNSNCGHDYGTNLADDEKRALLEYLKLL